MELRKKRKMTAEEKVVFLVGPPPHTHTGRSYYLGGAE